MSDEIYFKTYLLRQKANLYFLEAFVYLDILIIMRNLVHLHTTYFLKSFCQLNSGPIPLIPVASKICPDVTIQQE